MSIGQVKDPATGPRSSRREYLTGGHTTMNREEKDGDDESNYGPLYKKLLALPDLVDGQIIDGELVVMPKPRFLHQHVAGMIYFCLMRSFHYHANINGPGGWVIVQEVEVELERERQHYAPDIVAWRMPSPNLEKAGINIHAPFQKNPPHWACEVLSPRSEKYDRGAKLREYAKHGVDNYWIVDPRKRTIDSYQLKAGKYDGAVRFSGNAKASIPPFDSQTLDLSSIWV